MITNLLLGGVLLSAPIYNEYNSIGSQEGFLFQYQVSTGQNYHGVYAYSEISFFINENEEISSIYFYIFLKENFGNTTRDIGYSGHYVAISEIYEYNIPFNSLNNISLNTYFADINSNGIGVNQEYNFNFDYNGNNISFVNTIYQRIDFSEEFDYDNISNYQNVKEIKSNYNFISSTVCAPCAPCDTNFFSFMGDMFNSTIQILNFEIFEGFKLWYILGIPLFISLIFGVLKLLR